MSTTALIATSVTRTDKAGDRGEVCGTLGSELTMKRRARVGVRTGNEVSTAIFRDLGALVVLRFGANDEWSRLGEKRHGRATRRPRPDRDYSQFHGSARDRDRHQSQPDPDRLTEYNEQ